MKSSGAPIAGSDTNSLSCKNIGINERRPAML
jgi:hypothetical protein